MKKLLMCLTVLLSFVGVNKVSADSFDLIHKDSVEYYCNFHYTDYNYLKEAGFDDEIQMIYSLLIEEYNKNYSNDYPFYYIELVVLDDGNCNQINEADGVYSIIAFFNMFTEVPTTLVNGDVILSSGYNVKNPTFSMPAIHDGYSYLPLFVGNENIYNPLKFFISNFDYIHSGHSYNITGNTVMTINDGDIIKPIFSSENAFQDGYKEINLNDYAYVALALKDYSQDSFTSTVHVKGQYCITPVYDFGLKSYDSITNNRVTNICSPYYENYTPVVTYITSDNLKNNSIYYVKSYDDSKDNYIKVDTNVFDISYINIGEENNPYVSIQGKLYPTIPYDSLPSSATQNTEEGYVPGESVPFDPIGTAWDTFEDILDDPIDWIKDMWSAIGSIFSLITTFILLLPPIMRNTLYCCFIIAVSLGLIKLMF